MDGAGKTTTVCVTGAGGFVASWLVRLLLSRGDYVVHGTVRDPSDPKNAHLAALDGAGERLRLFKADVMDFDGVAAAIAGCEGVFHVASPVPAANPTNPDAEVLAPAVTGTQNVLRACHEAKVRRVVVVSSVAAVIMNPEVPNGAVVDEDCWSDEDYCRTTQMWYCLSKTLAERAARAYADKAGMDVVTVCPPLVLGPLLQSTVNTSSLRLLTYLKAWRDGTVDLDPNDLLECTYRLPLERLGETAEEKTRNVVDVRDVADALVLAYESPEASGRRLICSAFSMKVSETLAVIRSVCPNLKLEYTTKKFVRVEDEKVVSSKRLQALGWKFRTAEETLRDTIGSYQAAGILN